MSYFVPKNGIRIARSKYHVTLSVTSRWCHKHSILILLSFLRDRNRLIPRYSCPLSRSTSLFSFEAPQCQQLSRVWHQRDVTFVINSDQSPDHLKNQNGPTSSAHKIFCFNPRHLKLRNRVFQTTYFSTVPKKNSCHMHFKMASSKTEVKSMFTRVIFIVKFNEIFVVQLQNRVYKPAAILARFYRTDPPRFQMKPTKHGNYE